MNYNSFLKYNLLRKKQMIRKQQKKNQEKNYKQKSGKILSLFGNNQVISLGSMCFVKLFLNKINKNQETHFFDWIGTSVWSIRLALENNFEDRR